MDRAKPASITMINCPEAHPQTPQAGLLAAFLFLWPSGLSGLNIGARRLRRNWLRRCRLGLRFRCLRLLQRQLELLDHAFDPLRAGAELLAAELGELRLELLDCQLCDDEAVLGGGQRAALG